MYVSSEGSSESAHLHRLKRALVARKCDAEIAIHFELFIVTATTLVDKSLNILGDMHSRFVFVWFDTLRPSQHFSVMLGRVFLG